MRFSLKWLLAVMAYVALAVVALNEGRSHFGYVLWIATIGSLIYALTLAILAQGSSKGAAIGFFTAGLFYLAGVAVVEEDMPSSQVVYWHFRPVEKNASMRRSPSTSMNAGVRPERIIGWHRIKITHGAPHAIGVMLAGLIGAAPGALAARRVKENLPAKYRL